MFGDQLISVIEPAASEFERQLARMVALALRSTGYMQLENLMVHVDGHNVCLRGRVPSYYLKQKAHFVTLAVPGVRTLTDDIDVVS